MKIIGITGRSGSGKSTLSAALAKNGSVVLDGDEIAASLLLPGSKLLSALISAFGEQYLLPDGSLDRQKLGDLVFHDTDELHRLNSIVHPAFKKEIERRLSEFRKSEAPPRFVVIDAAVLFEAGLDGLCDLVVFVACSDEAAAIRIAARDGIGYEKAMQRIEAQKHKSGDFKLSRRADVTVISRGDIKEMERWAARLARITGGRVNG